MTISEPVRRLENQHDPKNQNPPLSFDPLASPTEFLEHCRSTHESFCSPVLSSLNVEVGHSRAMPTRRSTRVQKRGSEVIASSNLAPQSAKRKGKAVTASTSVTSMSSSSGSTAKAGPTATPAVVEAKKELLDAFTKVTAWRGEDGKFNCGLCQ
jgi:hypothetical protein